MYINNFKSIQPPFKKNQADSLTWLAAVYKAAQKEQSNSEEDYNKLLQRVACSEKQINTRHFFIPDPLNTDWSRQPIYPVKDSPHGVSMQRRHEFYHKAVTKLFDDLYTSRSFPDDIIHISCTGYISPSAAQMTALKAPNKVTVTHSYHMGCYGAFPALRMASGFLSSHEVLGRKESVDLVHTELCSLHMNPQDPTLEQMVIQSLFADGAIAYSMTTKQPQKGLRIKSLREELIPNSAEAMEWMVSDWGMKMTLSKDVPSMVGQQIREFTLRWLKDQDEKTHELMKKAVFAIHPGGPKIIDQVAQQLELRAEQIEGSRQLLRDRGNMSSATLPHLWERLIEDDNIAPGTPIISFAFGPGLTICGSLMEKV